LKRKEEDLGASIKVEQVIHEQKQGPTASVSEATGEEGTGSLILQSGKKNAVCHVERADNRFSTGHKQRKRYVLGRLHRGR